LNALPNSTISSAPNIVPNDVWVDLSVALDFSTQTFRVFLNGNPVGFGNNQALINVPFRDSDIANGPFDRLREYGYVSYFNTAAGVTTGEAYFDNFTVNAIAAVPEPSTFALIGLSLFGYISYRNRQAKRQTEEEQAEVNVQA
jgi:hypothetical protein